MSCASRRLVLHGIANPMSVTEAREPACAGGCVCEVARGMAGTGVQEQRLCGAGIVRLQRGNNGTTPRASHTDGEGCRPPASGETQFKPNVSPQMRLPPPRAEVPPGELLSLPVCVSSSLLVLRPLHEVEALRMKIADQDTQPVE
jgi:hypothetical protein